MPYSEYLSSFTFSPYRDQTLSYFETYSFSGVDATFSNSGYGTWSNAGAYGLYSYSESGSSSTTVVFAGGGGVSDSASNSTSYDLQFGQFTASYIFIRTAGGAFGNYGLTETASLSVSSDGSYLTSGRGTYDSSGTTTTYPVGPPAVTAFPLYGTAQTELETVIRKTTTELATYYSPIEESLETTYSRIITHEVTTVLSSIKTISTAGYQIKDIGSISNTVNNEWIGYASGGAQYIGLIYTSTGENKDISSYDSIIIETDTYSSSNQIESFNWQAGYFTNNTDSTYTLTYDIITTSQIPSTITTLEKLTISEINYFSYGFIKTDTELITVVTAQTTSSTSECTSQGEQFVFTYFASTETSVQFFKNSFSAIQQIQTTSNFTRCVEISGLDIATSFSVRSVVSTTSPFTYRSNFASLRIGNFNTGICKTYSPAPRFEASQLKILADPASLPYSFYTEKASFGSFAEPSYSFPYKGYSPAEVSLVFLALVPLNDTVEGKYPSWISAYNGTVYLANDRADSSLESVTLRQSSSFQSSSVTSVYQTIRYFIGNDTNSITTKTTSIVMSLSNSASSFSRLIRTHAENLNSAYINSYLPSIPLFGGDVVHTQGLQGDAGYNIDGLLVNAYTTNQSTFADSATSSFPVSTSNMIPIYRNKIRIDSGYSGVASNTFDVNLIRYSNYEL